MESIANLGWFPEIKEADFDSILEGVACSSFQFVRSKFDYRLSESQLNKLAKAAVANEAFNSELKYVKVAIVCDANSEFFVPCLRNTMLRYSFKLDVRVFEYGTGVSQSLNSSSDLYRFQPDLTFICYFGATLLSSELDARIPKYQENLIGEINLVIENLERNCGTKILLNTIPQIFPRVFGNIERKVPTSFWSQVNVVNSYIASLDYQFIDLESKCSELGELQWFSPKHYFWSKTAVNPRLIPLFCDILANKFSIMLGKVRKCLVLDLDNTLWGGVVGDDGLDHIKIGNFDIEGEIFYNAQAYYKSLASRGVILAVCSKNTFSNAIQPFRDHPEMLLKEDDFAAFVANWENKPDNIRQIASELNLGLDSLVFLDDNPVERAFVRAELPEVAVPEVPSDNPTNYPLYIESAGYFDMLTYSEDDRIRVSDYKNTIKRRSESKNISNKDEFLQSLEMKLNVRILLSVDKERAVQLFNRSNQFNLTTIRYSLSDIEQLMDSEKHILLSCSLQDRFGSSGVISFLVLERLDSEKVAIVAWVMSCRVLERGVEAAIISSIPRFYQDSELTQLIGVYLSTAKNSLVKDLYRSLTFREIEFDKGILDRLQAMGANHDGKERKSWVCSTDSNFPPCELSHYIEVTHVQ